jgi:hypothetical protein
MKSDPYIRINTAEDALSSMELAADFLTATKQDDRYWKWFVIATHAGLQGTFALALEAGNAFQVQKPSVTQKMLNGLDATPHMDNFLKLYKKIQCKENLRGMDSVPFAPTEAHNKAVERLDILRDNFIHFNAKSWSIPKQSIIESAGSALEVAEFVLLKSQSILWHETTFALRASSCVQRLRVLL